jgi:hypothetical protein
MWRSLPVFLAQAVASSKWSWPRSPSPRRHRTARHRIENVDSLEIRMLLSATGYDHDHELGFELQSDVFRPETHSLIEPGTFLTTAQPGNPLAIAEQFLVHRSSSFGLDSADLNYRVSSSSISAQTGTTHIYLQQTLDGLDIVNAVANVSVAKSGAVVSAASAFVSTTTASSALRESVLPTLSASQALESFVVQAGMDFEGEISSTFFAASRVPSGVVRHSMTDVFLLSAPGISRNLIPAERVLIPVKEGLEYGWRLNVQMDDGSHWFDAAVSAIDGEVLSVSDWVSHARYVVFAAPKESPSDGPRTNLLNPHNLLASPLGWHDTNGVAGAEFTTTQGNNVVAYTDTDANNVPDAGSAPDGTASLLFNFPLDLTQAPSTYRPAAVTNLFYGNNFIHDVTHHHGFDEASGNFQVTNYTAQGTGGDPVLAEAQDGSGTNNANFATPPEGTSPRMQMFNWTLTTPHRDGDFDNGIIYHEYGHGISNRLTGGPANSGALNTIQSGGMGEGWSDFWGLILTQTATDLPDDGRGIGSYALGQAPNGPGIRTQPYSYDFADNDHTFSDIVGSTSVHFVGETWATTLWDLNWALIHGNTLDASLPNVGLGFTSDFHTGVGGNTLLMKLVIEGMKLQPAQPSFLDARDAILQADLALTGGLYQETIWRVFARRGMGVSATDSGSNNTNVTEAFDLPLLDTITFPTRTLPGSQVSRVSGQLASPLAADETRQLRVFAEAKSRLTLTLTPDNPATILTVNLRKSVGTLEAGPFTAAAGQPVEISAHLLSVNNLYRIEIHSTLATDVSVDAVRNAQLESHFGDTTPASELNLSDSFVNVGAARHAVIGEASAGYILNRQSLPEGFIDISTTGTPLNLTDDQEVLITTTVGNTLLPAGTVVVGNNGALLKRDSLADVAITNAVLSAGFPGLFPFWDDIDSDTGNVFWEERSVGGIDTLIVQWHNRPHFSNVGSATFQAQVFASGPLKVRFAYQDVLFENAAFDNGASATIGIVSPAGDVHQHSFNAPNSILSGDVIDVTSQTDIDEYEFSATAGQIVDVIYDGLDNVNMKNSTVQLKQGNTVLATAVTKPLSAAFTASNYDLGISAFAIPSNGTYTVRIVGRVTGEYITLVTKNAAWNTENSNGSLSPRPRIAVGVNALGSLNGGNDTADQFVLNVTAGQTIRIDLDRAFDAPLSTPVNTLGAQLQLRTLVGGALLATSTNSAPGGLPRIIYTATATEDIRLNVARLSGLGDYVIKVNAAGSGLQELSATADSDVPVMVPTATTYSSRPKVEWNPVYGAESYDVWISNISTGQNPYLRTTVVDAALIPVADLALGRYQVYVQGVFPDGTRSRWSSPMTIDVLPKVESIRISPASATDSATIRWNPLSGAVRYDVWVDNRSASRSQVIRRTDISTSLFTVPASLTPATYQVWVRGIDARGVPGAWSIGQTFEAGNVSVPRLLPVVSTPGQPMTFQWMSVDDSRSYSLWVTRMSDPLGPAVVINQTGIARTSFTTTSALPSGTYRVWIRAVTASGTAGYWSTAQDITV